MLPSQSKEARATGLVLQDPIARPFSALDVPQEVPHRRLDVLVDDAWTGGVVAILGGIANRIAHVAQATLVDQVGDQLELVAAFKVRQLRWVSRLDQCLEGRRDERAHSTAQDGLLAKEIRLGFG